MNLLRTLTLHGFRMLSAKVCSQEIAHSAKVAKYFLNEVQTSRFSIACDVRRVKKIDDARSLHAEYIIEKDEPRRIPEWKSVTQYRLNDVGNAEIHARQRFSNRYAHDAQTFFAVCSREHCWPCLASKAVARGCSGTSSD